MAKFDFRDNPIWGLNLKSDALRSTAVMTLGSGIAQVLNFFITAYLARIYAPADFGMLATFVSISSLIAVVSTAKFDVALVVAKNRNEAIDLLRISIWVALFISTGLAIAIIFSELFLTACMHQVKNSEWFILMPIYVFILSVVQVAWMFNVREKTFGHLSVIRIFDPLVTGVVSFLLLSLNGAGLILGLLTGQAFVALILIARLYIRYQISPLKFEFRKYLKLAKNYADFPKFNILQGFGDTFLSSGILILGSAFYSSQVIGYVSMSMRVLQVPMGLIVKPLSHVFFSKASDEWRAGNSLESISLKTVKATALIASAMPLLMFVAGPELFAFIFGEEWRDAGDFARILSLWFFLELIKAPLAQIPSIIGKQKQILKWTFVSNALLALTIIFSASNFSALASLTFITALQCLQNLFFIFLFIQLSRKKA